MKWNNLKITILKELRGVIRDRKTLRQIIFMPFLIPIYILFMGFMFDMLENSDYYVGINYQMNATEKAIIDEMEIIKVKEYDSKEALEKAYEEGNIISYIIKENREYTIYADNTSNKGEIVSNYLNRYLVSYNQILGKDFLVSQNIDEDKVYNNLTIKEENLGSEGESSLLSFLLNMSVTFIMMIVVLGAGVIATDATAGEKERGTLETILTFPIKSHELIFGKYLAIAIGGIILGLVGLLLTFPTIILGKSLFKAYSDITISTSIGTIILLVLIIVISSLLAAGVSMALTGKSKTYKEAQSSLQALSFVVMIPYFLEIVEVDTSIFYVVPLANCGMALNDIIMNKINVSSLLTIIGTTIIYVIFIIIFISKQYKKEKTLFS